MKKYEGENEQLNAKYNGDFVKYLEAIFDSRNSFYKKAKILKYNDVLYLQSYETIVAKIEDKTPFVFGWYSTTTARHINEFLKQNNFEAMTKKEMQKINN